jgi:hypothetical protein
MLKIEKTVLPSPEQWEIIIEGMRNPMNSWDKMDSHHCSEQMNCYECQAYKEGEKECIQNGIVDPYIIGKNDYQLMTSLAKGGAVHAKYRRMIPAMFTVTAPTFWWIEFDTYKVGTVRNSCSKMHKIHVEPFTLDNFSHEGCDEIPWAIGYLVGIIAVLEQLREKFNETQEKKYWRALIEMLPHGYMMKATISLNYEVLVNIYHSRKNHKLDEWHTFCDWIRGLPYSELITGGE